MSEQEADSQSAEETDDLGTAIDPVDPLKRDPEEDETMPGLDPVVSPVPPE
jgi:hypothetical protein